MIIEKKQEEVKTIVLFAKSNNYERYLVLGILASITGIAIMISVIANKVGKYHKNGTYLIFQF